MTKSEPRCRAAIIRAHAPRKTTTQRTTNVRAARWVGRSKRRAAIWARTRGRALACLLLALTFLTTLTPHASAHDLTPADRTAITNVITNWSGALQSGDFGAMTEIIPPRILDHMAARANIDRSDLLDKVSKTIAETFHEFII